MRARVAARTWFAVTFLVVLVGMGVQLHASAGLAGTQFHSAGARIVNVFCYFTVWSNLTVMVTTGLLALRLDRPSAVFRAFRLAGLLGITVTFVVFHIALAHLQELQGSAAVADALLHTVSPVFAFFGWLLFGPRGQLNRRIVLLSLLFPVSWMVFALIRGPIVDYYAYPFADPRTLGYLQVAGNGVIVMLAWLALGFVSAWADRLLPGTGAGRTSGDGIGAPPGSPAAAL